MLVFPSIDLTFFGLWRNKIPSFEVPLTSTIERYNLCNSVCSSRFLLTCLGSFFSLSLTCYRPLSLYNSIVYQFMHHWPDSIQISFLSLSLSNRYSFFCYPLNTHCPKVSDSCSSDRGEEIIISCRGFIEYFCTMKNVKRKKENDMSKINREGNIKTFNAAPFHNCQRR